MKNLIYQGSVKNIYDHGDKLEFEFTDQFSIFDWGVMPNAIPSKGIFLADITEVLFIKLMQSSTYQTLVCPNFYCHERYQTLLKTPQYKALAQQGAKTHYLARTSQNSIAVKKYKVYQPKILNSNEYHYKEYEKNPHNALIPLEVVFRLGVPKGSSLLERSPKLKPNELFKEVMIEFYTKLEPKDRLLSEKEALQISGLTKAELQELKRLTEIYALSLHHIFSHSQIKLWDGKFEFAFGKKEQGKREIILADSIGPDELRLSFNGLSLSKEYLRSLYKETKWYTSFVKNKNCDNKPRELTSQEIKKASHIYLSLSKALKVPSQATQLLKELEESLLSKILILGKGGREHALAEHLRRSTHVKEVYVSPGNPGMSSAKIKLANISPHELVQFCKTKNIDFVVIGPEDLLAKGIADTLQDNGLACAAPSKAAAQMESSKVFAKKFMQKYNIPTAKFHSFSDTKLALSYLQENKMHHSVIKLSALAAGKGVVVCQSLKEGLAALKQLAPNNEEIIIEEKLIGKEVSYFALCLEEEYQILGTACDYKRLQDQDQGPNTGGMGCYSPADWLSKSELLEIENKILKPTLKAMKSEQIKFKGVLFIGLMITETGPKVLEYNVRFGDPETQTILPRLKTNLFNSIRAVAYENVSLLKEIDTKFDFKNSVHIVKAAKGYPSFRAEEIEKDVPIINNFKTSSCEQVYFAGVSKKDQSLLTNGGRVLGITSLANNKEQARSKAYEIINQISFSGEQYRKDIGQ
ncbi:MAG: phosphoribosylamine--glycine ligase [Bacteriovoracaceae bacterium]|jgi:phosphoribosylamine--glycine ligase|nr:phosphoribosylamine--glycine ligase [Halobacteriovoraceae bacterium]MDP7319844.1 phosphoribosylamine--glycine ligase [Bacteriovoracaceae bacterium]